jgi:hypothetical protein
MQSANNAHQVSDMQKHSHNTSFKKVTNEDSKQNTDSFYKITSIANNQMATLDVKINGGNSPLNEGVQHNVSQSRKSHFSPENHRIIDNLSQDNEELQIKEEIINFENRKSNKVLEEEINRQSIQIQEMAKVQKEILDTLRRQSEQMTRNRPLSKPQPRSQFKNFGDKQEQKFENPYNIEQQMDRERESQNMIMDSTHFNLGKSNITTDENNQLDPRNYSVFNIFQKRNTTSTQQNDLDNMYSNMTEPNTFLNIPKKSTHHKFQTLDIPNSTASQQVRKSQPLNRGMHVPEDVRKYMQFQK